MRFPFGRRKLSGSSSIGLTERGKRKVEECDIRGPSYFILNYLDEHGAVPIEEIAAKLDIDGREVTRVAARLVKAGVVRVQKSEEV